MNLYFDQKSTIRSPECTIRAYDHENGNALAGQVNIATNPGGIFVGSLNNLIVEERYRGEKGAANPLMDRAESELRRLGFKEASLFVTEANKHARRFYERRGWTCVRPASEIEQAFFLTSQPVLVYQKPLTQEHG